MEIHLIFALGHLYLGPVLEILLTSKSFVKFSTCSYERAGRLGSRDLGFSNRDLGK